VWLLLARRDPFDGGPRSSVLLDPVSAAVTLSHVRVPDAERAARPFLELRRWPP
jgi:hypothetical protein